MKTNEMDIVHIDNNPHNDRLENLQAENHGLKKHEWMGEYLFEINFAVQEWGIKNEMRLFGITIAEYGEPGKSSELKPRAKAYFADTGFKNMIIIFFDIKETGGKVTVSKSKAFGEGIKWPIKFARTKWESHHVDPVGPLYWVLIDRGIILPFRSTLKVKEWAALPFENASDMKPTRI